MATAKARPPPAAKAAAAPKTRDIGIDVPTPSRTCEDRHCPFHGSLPVRGGILDGVVVSTKMQGTVVVEREYLRYIPKFERLEKRTSRYFAHDPPCLDLQVGSRVQIAECRPLAKNVSFVVIAKR